MCGCNCSTCGGVPFCTGNLFLVAERIIAYCALTAVICCIVILFATALGIGIGLGYNYCVVDFKVQTFTPKAPALRSGPEENEDEVPDDARRSMPDVSSSSSTSEATTVTVIATLPAVSLEKYTLTLPLHGNMDFSSLLTKLRARNKNVTLELITVFFTVLKLAFIALPFLIAYWFGSLIYSMAGGKPLEKLDLKIFG